MPSLQIKRTTSDDLDFAGLVAQLDSMLAEMDGEKADFFAQLSTSESIRHAVIAYQDSEPVGCGGLRPFEDGVIEIKRMFVKPEVRGGGVGKAILAELEAWAGELGFKRAILETHVDLHAAHALYQGAGFTRIPNYGAYVEIELSISFAKILA